MVNIEGRNPVLEALKAGREIQEIMVLHSANGERIDQIYQLGAENEIQVRPADKNELDSQAESHSHQGVIARAKPKAYWDLDQLINKAENSSKPPLIVLLDEIKDPHNFGAILRTAEAAGAQGIVIPKRRAVGYTPVVAKASAGAIEHLPVAKVTNLARSIEQLKEAGFWITGADMDGDRLYHEVDFSDPTGLVIGSEGSGLRRLVKEKCDFLVRLPLQGNISSLNASVAAGIMIYEVQKQQTNEG